ncbi:hypothetical protein HET69_25110 [Streptomyces sp. CJ_13]|uniref:glutamate ligase domain-containing protein n=1 Tax=Streptomyces sp. CJ_13 TaxID=2724943 RepID=UPI001BDD843F|nr:cyanophycin synthetase [Streptomyces sp. CJ_13]MBT1187186.1 hypothetical protein [Streptomyces sp. CJ_13]
MEVTTRGDGVTVTDDAFNASPESALGDIAGPTRRKVAVLGEMAELGDETAGWHDQVTEHLVRLGPAAVIGIDSSHIDRMLTTITAAGLTTSKASDGLPLMEEITRVLRPGDVVLVKGAHSLGLEAVAANWPPRPSRRAQAKRIGRPRSPSPGSGAQTDLIPPDVEGCKLVQVPCKTAQFDARISPAIRQHPSEEGTVALRILGKDPDSKTGDSPTIYLDEERDTYVVQGWKILDAERRAQLDLPGHEDVIELPRRMVAFFEKEDRGTADV